MTDAMTRNSKKKLDSNKRRKGIRDKLLGAIGALAAEGEPYSTVSVERLATSAGVSRATFYIYFEGKADLLEAWFTDAEKELAAASRAWFDLDGSATQEDLAAALRGIARVYLGQQPLLAALNDEATQNTDLRDRFNAAVGRVTEDLTAHLEKGQREGWVDPDLLALETSAWLVWMLERGLGNVVARGDAEQAELRMANLASMFWHVLYSGSPAHSSAG